jgi:hypothetical protein
VTLRALAIALVALAAAAATVAAKAPPDSGVRGRVTMGPTCPAETDPPDPRCAPAPYHGPVRIRTYPERRFVKKVTTRDDGRYRARLKPGRYVLHPRNGEHSYPMCESRVVTVEAHRFTRAHLFCDTGIR